MNKKVLYPWGVAYHGHFALLMLKSLSPFLSYWSTKERFHVPKLYKNFVLNLTEHEIEQAHKWSKPIIVGILTFVTMINNIYKHD